MMSLLENTYSGRPAMRRRFSITTTKMMGVCSILFIVSVLSICFSYTDVKHYFDFRQTTAQNKASLSSVSILPTERNKARYSPSHSTYLKISGGDNGESPSKSLPQVVWLMSFPNSGTSFTMRLVSRMSNTTTATNYGPECSLNSTGQIQYLTDDAVSSGPYVLKPGMELPSSYILTKTHCGGRCIDCGPSEYIETRESFLNMCTRGTYATRLETATASKAMKESFRVYYSPKLVSKAIRLIRNPFDNIVSNFHLEQHEHTKKKKTKWLESYPNSVDGFRAWCFDLDAKYAEEEMSSRLLPDFVLNLFHGIPCHKAFYSFAKWHNHANEVIEQLSLPALTILYDDYEHSFNETVEEIFTFLKLDPIGPVPPFIKGKQYAEYFTREERESAKKLTKLVSDAKTWSLVENFF